MLVGFDLTGIGSQLGEALFEIKAVGTGDSGGAANGLHLLAWNENIGSFVDLASNSAATLDTGAMTATVPTSYKTSGGKLYLLLRSDYPRGGVGSTINIDGSSLRLVVPYVP